jgi:hypothetical protein
MPQMQESLLRTFDRTAEFIGLGPKLNADSIVSEALKESGRQSFSSTQFLEPLRHLVKAYEDEANLSVFGRFAARFDILRSLRNLLRFDCEEEVQSGIRARSISQPIFITGLPRSGTTFLHTLLSLDPLNVVPRAWQLIYPYADGDPESYRQRVDRQLWLFRQLSPGLDGMHPLSANTPQECTDITAQVFQSLRFDTTHHIPSYQKWIDNFGHIEAFRFHRRFLQHLDYQFPGRRWVLKCPDHIFTLNAIRNVYPDASFIVLHRDPISVLASVARLTDLLRRPFARRVDQVAIGRQVSERWASGADRMMELMRRTDRDILHIFYPQLVSNPLASVQRVYDHCGIKFTSESRLRLQSFIDLHPRGGYEEHHHSLEEYGLDPSVLHLRFSRYLEELEHLFGVGIVHDQDRTAA